MPLHALSSNRLAREATRKNVELRDEVKRELKKSRLLREEAREELIQEFRDDYDLTQDLLDEFGDEIREDARDELVDDCDFREEVKDELKEDEDVIKEVKNELKRDYDFIREVKEEMMDELKEDEDVIEAVKNDLKLEMTSLRGPSLIKFIRKKVNACMANLDGFDLCDMNEIALKTLVIGNLNACTGFNIHTELEVCKKTVGTGYVDLVFEFPDEIMAFELKHLPLSFANLPEFANKSSPRKSANERKTSFMNMNENQKTIFFQRPAEVTTDEEKICQERNLEYNVRSNFRTAKRFLLIPASTMAVIASEQLNNYRVEDNFPGKRVRRFVIIGYGAACLIKEATN